MTRYTPSRQYLVAGIVAFLLAAISGWFSGEWAPAAIPAVLLFLSSLTLLFLAAQPPIEIHDRYLAVGKRVIPWADIRCLDRTGWVSPLIVHLTLADRSRVLLIYPGDLDAVNSLLRQLRRGAREALIDGVPYRQFWGDGPGGVADRRAISSRKYPVLRPEDEAVVERLYHRLKTVGHLDPRNSSDES